MKRFGMSSVCFLICIITGCNKPAKSKDSPSLATINTSAEIKSSAQNSDSKQEVQKSSTQENIEIIVSENTGNKESANNNSQGVVNGNAGGGQISIIPEVKNILYSLPPPFKLASFSEAKDGRAISVNIKIEADGHSEYIFIKDGQNGPEKLSYFSDASYLGNASKVISGIDENMHFYIHVKSSFSNTSGVEMNPGLYQFNQGSWTLIKAIESSYASRFHNDALGRLYFMNVISENYSKKSSIHRIDGSSASELASYTSESAIETFCLDKDENVIITVSIDSLASVRTWKKGTKEWVNGYAGIIEANTVASDANGTVYFAAKSYSTVVDSITGTQKRVSYSARYGRHNNDATWFITRGGKAFLHASFTDSSDYTKITSKSILFEYVNEMLTEFAISTKGNDEVYLPIQIGKDLYLAGRFSELNGESISGPVQIINGKGKSVESKQVLLESLK